MSRYVIKFKKEGYMRYISHLDLFRLFKRSFSRMNIVLQHSQGFNPHPKMSFVQPLSLGYSSTGEYLEFDTLEKHNETLMINQINEAMPSGIEIIGIKELPLNKKTLSAIVEYASYTVELHKVQVEGFELALQKFLSQGEILREKKQKTGKVIIQDIKPMITSVKTDILAKDQIELTIMLRAGSNCNLNPDVFLTAFFSFTNREYTKENATFNRNEMYLTEKESGEILPIIS